MNAQKSLFLAVVSLLACGNALKAQSKNPQYKIVIKMKKVDKEAPALFMTQNGNRNHLDTIYANANNEYVISGEIPKSERGFLKLLHHKIDPSVPPNDNDGTPVYLKDGETVRFIGNDSISTAIVEGSPYNKDYQDLSKISISFDKKIKQASAEWRAAGELKDSVKIAATEVIYFKLMADKKEAEKKFFLTHLNTPCSLDWLRRNVNVIKEKSLAAELFNKMSDDIKKSTAGVVYSSILNQTKGADVGFEAPDISAKQPSGENLSLRSLRGKYVLLDFWASWCGPCRKENPNLVKTYNNFKDKNFEILGYSLDEGSNGYDRWVAAIKKDNLTWNQISDIAGWDALAAKIYGVTAVPANFLIDPNGKIIAKDLRGEALDKKLQEILK